jgi:hypothetical protein
MSKTAVPTPIKPIPILRHRVRQRIQPGICNNKQRTTGEIAQAMRDFRESIGFAPSAQCLVLCSLFFVLGAPESSFRLSQALFTKHQAQSTKHKAPSTKHKAQSTPRSGIKSADI